MERLRRTFTLVELILITAIISILVALAIPNLLRARLFAREAMASNLLRLIYSAETEWRAVNPQYATLAEMASVQPPYLDVSLASGKKQNYNIVVSPSAGLNFYVTAAPDNLAQAHSYYIDEDGVLCRSNSVNTLAPANHTETGCPAGFSAAE